MRQNIQAHKRVLLIIGGGIAAYKSLELIRLLRKQDIQVTPVLTQAGAQFVTPLSLATLAQEEVHQDLFDLTKEVEIGHIQLSRHADLIVVAPATADLIGKMATGRADDLATTVLLATDTPVFIAPAMNVRMWQHPAVQRNVATLQNDGITLIGPELGEMACGEYGPGRMAEPEVIASTLINALGHAQKAPPLTAAPGPLSGRHIIITSGPTHEPIDPVRYIANRSSGKQGRAIAEALHALGARITFIAGPASQLPSHGGNISIVHVETAVQMHNAVMGALPADAAIFVAAVADWRVQNATDHKIKKTASADTPTLILTPNPDILADVSHAPNRPTLVIGFAAETQDVLENAQAKRQRKGCDWLLANDVSPQTQIMGGDETQIVFMTKTETSAWPRMSKEALAHTLAQKITTALTHHKKKS